MIVLAAVEITIGAMLGVWFVVGLMFIEADGERLALMGVVNFIAALALVVGGIVLLHKLGIG